jgi:Mrp family chromosome partitioning ATPase
MDVSARLSRQMESLLAGYTAEYDFIIIDATDIQSSSAPLIISKLADTVLLVLDCRDCPVYQLQVVLWRLRRARVNVAGCVINHFPVNKRRQDYEFYQLLFRKYKS